MPKTAIPKAPEFANLDSYLGAFSADMAARVTTGFRPLFDPESDTLSPAVLQLSDEAMQPYPAQAVGIEAVLRLLDRQRCAHVVGEQGTGKTPMGLWIVRAQEVKTGQPQRVVITAPNQLVKKWQRHAQMILPGCQATIVRTYKDLLPLARSVTWSEKAITHADGGTSVQRSKRILPPSRTEVWILPRDRGKLGYAWANGVLGKTTLITTTDTDGSVRLPRSEDGRKLKTPVVLLSCPKCGGSIVDEEGEEVGLDYFTKSDGGPKSRRCCGRKGWDPLNPERKCNEQLWQAFNGGRSPFAHDSLAAPGISPRRVAPCVFLRKLGVRFDFYIADEVHELRGEGSLQGQMFADLCGLSRRRVLLTGTLVGGYATNLLHILWRTMPERMRADGQQHSSEGFDKYTQLYGVLQTITRYVCKNSAQSINDLMLGRGKSNGRRQKVLPGISPVLFVHFLLDSAVFIRLAEMHDQLPPFSERVHVVRMTREQDEALAEMQDAFAEHRERVKPCRAWSAAQAAFMRWPDKSWVTSYPIWDVDPDEGTRILAFTVPSLPKREYAKERRIRRLVRRNMLRGRKTWVFTELTGRDSEPAWDWMDYLAGYLGQHGIRAAVLRSGNTGGPDPEDREEWIAKMTPDVDVIISNPTLVQTGLDLYDFPSIVYAHPGQNTYTLRQASRRAWRLGQSLDCEVDYLVYTASVGKSVQKAAMTLMSKKMAASLAIEGDFTSEGLAALSDSDDMATQLAKFIDGRLEELDDVKDAFATYRKKLQACVPANVMAKPVRIRSGQPAPLPAPMPAVGPAISVLADVPVAPQPIRVVVPVAPVVAEDAESKSIRERKAARLEAACLVLGGKPDESNGDVYRFGDRWYQLIAKKRSTVRDRNFLTTLVSHPDAWLLFVEPVSEMGPCQSDARVTVGGIEYSVSGLAGQAWLAGERKPARIEVEASV